MGHMFFIVTDARSKWPEVEIMTSTTSDRTIQALRSMFARYGLPEQLVSDSGPLFISSEFEQFLKGNKVKHIWSATYHPSSNGQVERFVQTMKRALKNSEKDGKTIQHRLAEFLFEYRTTPHTTTNMLPSELMLNRKLRTCFNLLRSDVRSHVTSEQATQKAHHDKQTKCRLLFPGASVMVRIQRMEFARLENASVSCIELDCRDFPSPNSGELGGSSMLS